MTQVAQIHPDNPQSRLIDTVVECLLSGGIIVYPTDSAYALGCQMGNKSAQERIRRIRKLSKDHNFTLMCQDLSEIALYARVNNTIFRLLKSYTPGPYTFILKASRDVPKRLQHEKRKTVGIRVPDHPIAQAILNRLGEPMMSVTLILPEASVPLSDPDEIKEALTGQVDMIVDAGSSHIEPTSIIDLESDVPRVVRVGRGDITAFV